VSWLILVHRTNPCREFPAPLRGALHHWEPEDPLGLKTRKTDAVTWETRLATPLRVEIRDAAQDGTEMEDQPARGKKYSVQYIAPP
jgi:hypothetical protein